MKNNQVVQIGEFGDHDLARLSLRETLNSMLQFGRVSLKAGETRPRYDVKADAGKGVITRSDGSVLAESNLADLVENGKKVRLALIAYRRLLRERDILQSVRDNRDLQVIVNTRGAEVVVFDFDNRSKSRVQRFRLTRDVYLSDVGVTVTALPKSLTDAVELGEKIEANFLKELEAAKQAGDENKVTRLEFLGAALGVFRVFPVRDAKAYARDAKAKVSPKEEAKPAKKRRNRRRGKKVAPAATTQQTPVAQVASESPATSTDEKPKKKRRRGRRRNRKSGNAPSVQPDISTPAAQQ